VKSWTGKEESIEREREERGERKRGGYDGVRYGRRLK
jgi:hypothetical protein